jgi:hypothetical protein
MRGSYSGNTLAFQAKADSSILLPRSKVKLVENAPMAKLVDAPDLGSGIERCVGSSPTWGTNSFCLVSLVAKNTCFFEQVTEVRLLAETLDI